PLLVARALELLAAEPRAVDAVDAAALARVVRIRPDLGSPQGAEAAGPSRSVTPACVLEVAAHAGWRAGEPLLARTLLSRAEQLRGPSTGPTAHALALTGRMELLGGAVGSARGTLLDAARGLAAHDPHLAVDTLVLAADAVCQDAAPRDHADALAQARALVARGVPGADLVVAYLTGLAAALGLDHATARDRLGLVVRRAEDANGPLRDPLALVRAGMAAIVVGDDLAARRIARRAVTAARDRQDAATVPHALQLAAYADLALGRHTEASTAAVESAHLARATGQDGVAAGSLALAALLAALSGDTDTCHDRLRRLRAPSDAEPTPVVRGLVAWALAALDLHAGRAPSAVGRLAPLVTGGTDPRRSALQVPAALHLVEAVGRAGGVPGAVRAQAVVALDVVEGWAALAPSPTWRALCRRGRAHLSGDATEAHAHYEAAVDAHRAGDSDFAWARTELLFGEDLRRHRRPAEAREHLRCAEELFDHLGEEAWCRRTRSELRAAGERDAGGPHVTVDLTPRQEQIAVLVAQGATNKEVADRMFLSTRTVEHHLRGIFTRLGVRSRTELAGLLAGTSPQ
ncbi:LuxR C-terminal-related transcriptional regulator, partial [Thalassiella azotivora]